MKEIFAVVVVVCASSLICTLMSVFVNDSSTKKIINLVLGAFIICSLIVPVKNAYFSFNKNVSEYEAPEGIVSTNDEAFSKEVLAQTTENLEKSLTDIMLQNGIKINSCKIILSLTDENSIIISSISIYINEEYIQYADLICSITQQNFGIMPSVMTE